MVVNKVVEWGEVSYDMMPLEVAPGQEMTCAVQPRALFRALYIFIERPIPFTVLGIAVGRVDQITRDFQPASFPATVLDEMARRRAPLNFDRCHPMLMIEIRLRNDSPEWARFAGKIVGDELRETGLPLMTDE
jgi:hypothetical protein